jgi:hypothetical protein
VRLSASSSLMKPWFDFPFSWRFAGGSSASLVLELVSSVRRCVWDVEFVEAGFSDQRSIELLDVKLSHLPAKTKAKNEICGISTKDSERHKPSQHLLSLAGGAVRRAAGVGGGPRGGRRQRAGRDGRRGAAAWPGESLFRDCAVSLPFCTCTA